MPEIQKIWVFRFCRNILLEMIFWNWFEFVCFFFCEFHELDEATPLIIDMLWVRNFTSQNIPLKF